MTHSCPTRRASDLCAIGCTVAGDLLHHFREGIARLDHAVENGDFVLDQLVQQLRCGRARPGRILEHKLGAAALIIRSVALRSEEHTSELQSLMRISYAVFCLKKKKTTKHYN